MKGYKDTLFTYQCKTCGREVSPVTINADPSMLRSMVRRKLCYSCVYWKKLAAYPPKNYIVVQGHLITCQLVKDDPFAAILKKRTFLADTDLNLIVYNEKTDYGKIPEQFLRRFPRKGAVIEQKVYTFLKRHKNFKCMKKGCYDRYHCVFYDLKEAEPKKPWNKIPKNYKVGWEECPLFLNKNLFQW